MNKFFKILRIFGPAWMLFRLRYALKIRSGYFEKKLPIRSWKNLGFKELFLDDVFAGKSADEYADYKRKNLRPFIFCVRDFPHWREQFLKFGSEKIDEELEHLQKGDFFYFENQYSGAALSSCWNINPFSGDNVPPMKHWSRLGDFGFGDIKIIWEPSRFAFVYPLVRKFVRTGDNRYAEYFWNIFEDWVKNNPPEAGVNWKCGQEISFRLMALCFALYTFVEAPATNSTRLLMMVRVFSESARRIVLNIDYALSQKNNHGVSECVGLICSGILFPELRGSKEWLFLGRKYLNAQLNELVYADGGFSQHSLNYHRVMMQDLSFAYSLLKKNGVKGIDLLRRKLEITAIYAREFILGNNGEVPCFGANDGAHIFRLSECEYGDFRSHIQSAMILSIEKRAFSSGKWDEEAIWFSGNLPEKNVQKIDDSPYFSGEASGVHIVKKSKISLFFRCGKFVHRPGHNDLLHIDIWRSGKCVIGDSGSFSYNTKEKFISSHNIVEVDGLPQMEKLSRFLSAPANGKIIKISQNNGVFEIIGTHDGYCRLKNSVNVIRKVLINDDRRIFIEDKLISTAMHEFAVRWMFPKMKIRESMELNCFEIFDEESHIGNLRISFGGLQIIGTNILFGDEQTGEGFVSPHYNERIPAQCLILKFSGSAGIITSEFEFKD